MTTERTELLARLTQTENVLRELIDAVEEGAISGTPKTIARYESALGNACAVPATIDWNPALARQRGEPQRQVRYLNGAWPATATVVRHFGSWTAALKAAGLEGRMSGPRRDIYINPDKLSRRNLDRLRRTDAYANQRVGPAAFAKRVRAVAEAERVGEPELLQDALIECAATALAWADRAER